MIPHQFCGVCGKQMTHEEQVAEKGMCEDCYAMLDAMDAEEEA